jgi:hypothetical protein
MASDATGERAVALVQLVQDAATAEVVTALEARGIRAILIKGAAIAERLYDNQLDRPYRDGDLLVEFARYDEAEQTIEGLGFTDPLRSMSWAQPGHAHTWSRGRATIDLHHRLGLSNNSRETWNALSTGALRQTIGGREIEVPGNAALALIITAHAVQHGAVGTVLGDLRRAVERFSVEEWRDAAARAQRLGMAEIVGAGLREVPHGHSLATELALPTRTTPDINRRLAGPVTGAPSLTSSLFDLTKTESVGGFLRVLARKIVPPPDFMRYRWPPARRSRTALVLSYFLRPLQLAPHLPAAVRQWRAARRAARGQS